MGRGDLLMERSISGWDLFNFGAIIRTLDLEGLTVRLLALNHSVILSRSFCMWERSLDGFETENNKQVSSAKSRGIQLTDDCKSLMYNKNSKGPRVEP